MQKLFLFLSIFCICIASAFAQDVITLKNAEEIQAIVQEIGEVEIKYKKFENPNGPNYTLKKSEIFTIKYENGSRDVFVDEVAVEQKTDEPVIATTTTALTTSQQNTQIQRNTQLEPLSIQNLTIYDSNGIKLSRYEVQNVMREIPEALNLYNSGKRNRAAGLVFGIPGIALGFGGLIVIAANNQPKTYEEVNMREVGTVMSVVGTALNIPGIILMSVGNKRIKQSVNAYNKGIKQTNTSDISFDFGITNAGGIGLVINF